MNTWDITFEMDWDPPGRGILNVKADCEDGSKCDFEFRLPVDVCEQLHRAVARELDPYMLEKAAAKAAFDRGDESWKPKDVKQAEAQELLDDGVYDDDPAKRDWAERAARGEA